MSENNKQNEQNAKSSGFSADDVVSALLSYYQFLTTVYLPSDYILVPGDKLWPELPSQAQFHLGKTPAVFDLLRRLPYVQQRKEDERETLIWYACVCIDYSSTDVQEKFSDYEQRKEVEGEQAYLNGRDEVTIARGYYSIVLDTLSGQVKRVWSHMNRTETFADMKAFVEHAKQEFIDLSVIAIDQFEMTKSRTTVDEYLADLQAAYRNNGWPGEKYDKAACLLDTAEAKAAHNRRAEAREAEKDRLRKIEQQAHRDRGYEDWEESDDEDWPEEDAEAIEQANTTHTPYNVGHVAQQMLSLYQFLIDLYIPAEALKLPPPEGWPNISTEPGQWKHPRVMELLKHLPYLDTDHQIWDRCLPNDLSNGPQDEGEYIRHTVPTQVFLAREHGREGSCFLFDTLTGGVRRFAPFYADAEDENFYFDNIDDFVETTKDEFERLVVLPDGGEVRILSYNEDDEEAKQIRATLYKHGWATADWDREAGYQALQELYEEHRRQRNAT